MTPRHELKIGGPLSRKSGLALCRRWEISGAAGSRSIVEALLPKEHCCLTAVGEHLINAISAGFDVINMYSDNFGSSEIMQRAPKSEASTSSISTIKEMHGAAVVGMLMSRTPRSYVPRMGSFENRRMSRSTHTMGSKMGDSTRDTRLVCDARQRLSMEVRV